MHTLGLSPLVTIETRCQQPSTGHRAKPPIYFRYSSTSHTRVWDSDLWWHTKPRNTSPEKKSPTPSLRALHPGTDLWLMPDNSRAIETWTDTSKAQSQVAVFSAFTCHTPSLLGHCVEDTRYYTLVVGRCTFHAISCLIH